MSSNTREKVIDAVASCMHRIFVVIPEEDFRNEATALMGKWANEHGSFGIEGITEAVLWWQEMATETNAFPLSRN